MKVLRTVSLALLLMGGLGAAQAITCSDLTIPPSNPDNVYTDHGDGTVTDSRSGLMWKKCAQGQTYSGGTCTGTASVHTWAAALGLGVSDATGGYSDWRLPDLKELHGLVEGCRYSPAINDTLFPNTPNVVFWSGSPYADGSNYAWYVYFSRGVAYNVFRDYGDGSVRLVRGGQSFDSLGSDATPSVSSFTPTSGTTGTTATVTVNGSNFPSTLIANIDGQQPPCTQQSVSSTQGVFSCPLSLVGARTFEVKNNTSANGGTVIYSGTFTVTSDINTRPVLSQASIGTNGISISGSFVATDADGDKLTNIRLRLRDSAGMPCTTSFLNSAGLGKPVAAGTINFSTQDCVSRLNMNANVTYWIEAWDMRGAKAAELTDVLVISNNAIVPYGTTIRWDLVPDEVIVGETATLKLSVVDSSGNVVTAYSGKGTLTAIGFDIETRDRRSVWFENGVATIEDFKAVTAGQGTLNVKALANVASAPTGASANASGLSARANAVQSTVGGEITFAAPAKNITAWATATKTCKRFTVHLDVSDPAGPARTPRRRNLCRC